MTLKSHPSSSSSDESFQICIVMESNFEHKYQVFLVDFGVDFDGKVDTEELNSSLFCVPLNYPDLMSFFAFRSRIYFLGGIIPPPLRRSTDVYSRDVYVYDTSSNEPQIQQIGKMNIGKMDPLVFGPIKEKFYVTSRCLWFGDLEEFNPKSNSWKRLDHPPVVHHYQNSWYMINSYVVVVVNNCFKILMSTKLGIFSYDIDEDKWDLHLDESLPFEQVALSIDKDRDIYLMHNKDKGFHTCSYKPDHRTWDDLQDLKENLPNSFAGDIFYCMSLGDSRVCAVKSIDKYPVSESCCVDPLIKVTCFEAKNGCDLRLLHYHLYKQETYDNKDEGHFKQLKDSFPFPIRRRNATDVVDRGTKKSNKKRNKERNKQNKPSFTTHREGGSNWKTV